MSCGTTPIARLQAVLGHPADVLAVDLDRSLIDVPKAEQQARDRRFAGAARADDRDRGARSYAEIDIAEDRAARIVAEIDMAKGDGPGPDRASPDRHRASPDPERRRAGPILDLGPDRHERRHLLEIGHRLLDVAVDDAEEVERGVELDQIGVDQHEIANGHPLARDPLAGEDHDADETGGDDRALAEIEQRERGVAADRGAFIGVERRVVAARLVRLVGKVFDCLEIEEAVDRLGAGLAVALVHLAAKAHPPVGHQKGEADVEEDRRQGDGGELPIVEPPQDAAHQQHFEQGRQNVEQHERQQEIDAGGAALNRPREAPGAAFEVKAQRQRVDMGKRRQGQPAHRALGDRGEHRGAQFVEPLRHDARQPVADDQRHRHRDHRLARGQCVDRVLVEERDADADEPSGNHEGDRQHHPDPQPGRLTRP